MNSMPTPPNKRLSPLIKPLQITKSRSKKPFSGLLAKLKKVKKTSLTEASTAARNPSEQRNDAIEDY